VINVKNKGISSTQNKNLNNASRVLVLTGGGTAGHVMPHLAVLPVLMKNFDKVYYIGSHKGIEREIIGKNTTLGYFSVATAKLRRSVDIRNLTIPFQLIKGTREAKRLLKQLGATVVFSKGGFVAYPVVRAAGKLGIPVVAHESDMSMGLANKLSAKHCKTICTTFKKTTEGKGLKYVHTGAPIRPQVYNGIPIKIQKRHGFDETDTRKNLLVFGGSLGATAINTRVREGLDRLLKTFRIVHITGRGKVDTSLSKYEPKGYVQLEFVDDIQNYFAWADAVISRAGSNSVCELMALKKPTLFVPLSSGRGDQIENAVYVKGKGAAEVISEANLTQSTMLNALERLVSSSSLYAANIETLGNLDGTEKIAKIILG
jgi:UDP-N-acetylglucosamine--N-acetylmuramyl-(pentapeptide) pyrophosphoryl-undecaprenol N-acetylglucosamine transferase